MKTTIQLEIPPQIQLLADVLDVTVEQIVRSYLFNLAQSISSGGSDERMMAADFFLRTGLVGDRYEKVQTLLGEFRTIRETWYDIPLDKAIKVEDAIAKKKGVFQQQEKEGVDRLRQRYLSTKRSKKA